MSYPLFPLQLQFDKKYNVEQNRPKQGECGPSTKFCDYLVDQNNSLCEPAHPEAPLLWCFLPVVDHLQRVTMESGLLRSSSEMGAQSCKCITN